LYQLLAVAGTISQGVLLPDSDSEILGLFFRYDRSDFGVGKRRDPFGHGGFLHFWGFHFPLEAFCLKKAPKSLRLLTHHDEFRRTTQKEKGLISQAFLDSIGRYWNV
jgi:hypothetical protein